MRRPAARRRGFSILIVLAAMLLLAGVFTVLTRTVVGFHQARAYEGVRRTARVLADSGVAYVRSHRDALREQPSGVPVALDVAELLPPNVAGTLLITLDEESGTPMGIVHAKAVRRGFSSKETRRVRLD